jgi:hypothetical protein
LKSYRQEDEEEGEETSEEEERPVRRSCKVKRDAPRRRPVAVVDSTDDDEEDLLSLRSSSSRLRTARRKLLHSTSTKSVKVRTARRKLLNASNTDREDDYAPSPSRKSPKVRRRPQTSSGSLSRYEDDLISRFQGFTPMGPDSPRSGLPIYMPGTGMFSNPYFPTYGPPFPPPSPLGPYGYDVGMPGPIFNAGGGNIINSTISNVGNDNSVLERDRRK